MAHQNHTEVIGVSSVVAEQRGCFEVIDVSWLTTSHACVRDRCKQGFHRHMSSNTGFMNFPIETVAAFPSLNVAAFPLTSTVQPSLDPLSVPLGVSSCRETCTATTSDASAILVTVSGD